MAKEKASAGKNGANKATTENKLLELEYQEGSHEAYGNGRGHIFHGVDFDVSTFHQAGERTVVTLQFNCSCIGCCAKVRKGATKATLAGCPNPKLSVDQSKRQVTVTGYLAGDAAYVAKLVKAELGRSVVDVVEPAAAVPGGPPHSQPGYDQYGSIRGGPDYLPGGPCPYPSYNPSAPPYPSAG